MSLVKFVYYQDDISFVGTKLGVGRMSVYSSSCLSTGIVVTSSTSFLVVVMSSTYCTGLRMVSRSAAGLC